MESGPHRDPDTLDEIVGRRHRGTRLGGPGDEEEAIDVGLDGFEVGQVIAFMLTRPRGMTIRDVVMLPSQFDL